MNNNYSYAVILMLAFSLLFTGCADIPDTAKTSPDSVPSIAADSQNLFSPIPETIAPPKEPFRTGFISNDTENPYTNDMSLTYFQHYIFELYRGAERVEFNDFLEYSVSAERRGYEFLRFELYYPLLGGATTFDTAANEYYLDRLTTAREQENYYYDMSLDSVHGVEYRQRALYAYTWENYYSVISCELRLVTRTLYTPLSDNFDLNSGTHLTLNDIFTVEYDEYGRRINDAIFNTAQLDPNFEYLTPSIRDRDVPLPQPDGFMLTPNGLALIYMQGSIASEGGGAVILTANYSELSDILAISVQRAA